jgi:ubiquitin carboxyl-terminal hydrolase 10
MEYLLHWLIHFCRQEDAQEFLSFAMDRMHDELLKLNGNGLNSKEGMVVSSVDDDAWETVGRKNKSAIVRTQSFVPSELSAIFGGQLQSVVKAQGIFVLSCELIFLNNLHRQLDIY